MNSTFEEFTEDNYRNIIKRVKNRFCPIMFTQYKQPGNNVLWRHDIDFSVHRAYRLAVIESEEGFFSTFFVNLHCEFYNALEMEIVVLIRRIIDLGHKIGLHFDPHAYFKGPFDCIDLEKWLLFEKNILGKVYNADIQAFSYHNPDTSHALSVEDNEVAGMVNAYSKYLKEHYSYCSDSNGFWRFTKLTDFIVEPKNTRIQVLTHPGWWTPEAMSPRSRISRCIDGRAATVHRRYDEMLELEGRMNVR